MHRLNSRKSILTRSWKFCHFQCVVGILEKGNCEELVLWHLNVKETEVVVSTIESLSCDVPKRAQPLQDTCSHGSDNIKKSSWWSLSGVSCIIHCLYSGTVIAGNHLCIWGQVEYSSPIKVNSNYKVKLSSSVVVYFSRGSGQLQVQKKIYIYISSTVFMLEAFWKKCQFRVA